ncbi:hypothetical protein EYS14_08935 [Alteromonadaceae bacterium M269]|nr:hypothetical protein EYS14_08935 [Alteromonadaceae bacterium M269]
MAIESAVNAPRNTVLIGPSSRDAPRANVVRDGSSQRTFDAVNNRPSVIIAGDERGQQRASQFNQEGEAIRDEPNTRNRRAIAAYQSFSREERRAEVQSLLGVDTFI